MSRLLDDGEVDALPEEPVQDPEQPDPEDAAPESPLAKLLAEKGLDEAKAAELLSSATDEQAREEREQAQMRARAQFDEMYEQRFQQEGGQRFAGYLRDREYAQRALEHIAAHHPDLASRLQPGGKPEADDPDPVAALAKRSYGEVATLKRELAELKEQSRNFQQQQFMQQHEMAVGLQLARFTDRLPEHLQKYEAALTEELREAYDANPARFKNPSLTIKPFLEAKLKRLSQYDGSAAQPKPKTMPPRSASGAPAAAPVRKRLPDLSPHGLAREAMSFFSEHGVEE